jgi:polyhydroxybutyrate depolymerase
MKYLLISFMTTCFALTLLHAHADSHQAGQISRDAVHQTFNIDGQPRDALIYPNSKPAPKTGAPLVLGFHGHGGRAQFVARRWDLQTLWPEAVIVYLQGLPGVAGITDKEGKLLGWQKNPGEQNDRDVKFVDAVLEQISKQHKIDANRIYAVGHSNGARFVNVLWKLRGERFAAFCSASAQGGLMIRDAVPRSIFAVAGEKDPLVPYDGQLKSIEFIRHSVLKTDPAKAVTKGYARFEPGSKGTELATYLHPGGHEFPPAALPLVIEFFKRNARP